MNRRPASLTHKHMHTRSICILHVSIFILFDDDFNSADASIWEWLQLSPTARANRAYVICNLFTAPRLNCSMREDNWLTAHFTNIARTVCWTIVVREKTQAAQRIEKHELLGRSTWHMTEHTVLPCCPNMMHDTVAEKLAFRYRNNIERKLTNELALYDSCRLLNNTSTHNEHWHIVEKKEKSNFRLSSTIIKLCVRVCAFVRRAYNNNQLMTQRYPFNNIVHED